MSGEQAEVKKKTFFWPLYLLPGLTHMVAATCRFNELHCEHFGLSSVHNTWQPCTAGVQVQEPPVGQTRAGQGRSPRTAPAPSSSPTGRVRRSSPTPSLLPTSSLASQLLTQHCTTTAAQPRAFSAWTEQANLSASAPSPYDAHSPGAYPGHSRLDFPSTSHSHAPVLSTALAQAPFSFSGLYSPLNLCSCFP